MQPTACLGTDSVATENFSTTPVTSDPPGLWKNLVKSKPPCGLN